LTRGHGFKAEGFFNGALEQAPAHNENMEDGIMSLLVGGAVAAVLGLIGFFFWWTDFLTILKGGVPILLFLGGILAVYIGVDEIHDRLQEERKKQEESLEKAREEIEMVRAQAEQYREELEKLKEEKKKQE
jgi:ABC-type multidrug transport system fused ATPase/permease subunit